MISEQFSCFPSTTWGILKDPLRAGFFLELFKASSWSGVKTKSSCAIWIGLRLKPQNYLRKIKEEGGVGWRMNQEQVEGNIARAERERRREVEWGWRGNMPGKGNGLEVVWLIGRKTGFLLVRIVLSEFKLWYLNTVVIIRISLRKSDIDVRTLP